MQMRWKKKKLEQNQTKEKMRKLKEETKFSNEDYQKWKAFRNIKKTTITHEEYNLLCDLHATYYEHKLYRPSKCCGQKTLQKYVEELHVIFDKGL